MFIGAINRTNQFSLALKNKICVNHVGGLDETLFMTATILLYDRVNELKFSYHRCTQDCVADMDSDPSIYSIYIFDKITTSPDELLKTVKTNYKTIEKLPTHEKFISEQLKQQIHIRYMPNENTACIFAKNVTYPLWHCVSFLIPKLFQVFESKPLTNEEKSFLETLTFKTGESYIKKLTELSNKESFRKYTLRFQLEAFERKMFEKKVESARSNLNNLELEMDRAMESYRKACAQRIEAQALVCGLESMYNKIEDHTELQKYLIDNPRISNVELNDSSLSFIVKTYFAPHHISEWDSISKSGKIFNMYSNNKFKPNDVKLILDGIMSENRCLKLKMCAYFSMDYFGSSVKSQIGYNYINADESLKDYIPNPHLHYHNCFGQNKTAILEQLKIGDTIGAIECAIACAQRINIHDMSFDKFVPDVLEANCKCFVSEEGKEMDVDEALEYLKGRNNEQN